MSITYLLIDYEWLSIFIKYKYERISFPHIYIMKLLFSFFSFHLLLQWLTGWLTWLKETQKYFRKNIHMFSNFYIFTILPSIELICVILLNILRTTILNFLLSSINVRVELLLLQNTVTFLVFYTLLEFLLSPPKVWYSLLKAFILILF